MGFTPPKFKATLFQRGQKKPMREIRLLLWKDRTRQQWKQRQLHSLQKSPPKNQSQRSKAEAGKRGEDWILNRLSKNQRLALVAMSLLGLALEILGVNSGCYQYGNLPLKFFGVPISIVVGWAIVCAVAYFISTKKGLLVGVLTAYAIDLALEPIAHFTGIWTWANTQTAQIYFGSTVGNVIIWLLMLVVGTMVLTKINSGDVNFKWGGEGMKLFRVLEMVVGLIVIGCLAWISWILLLLAASLDPEEWIEEEWSTKKRNGGKIGSTKYISSWKGVASI